MILDKLGDFNYHHAYFSGLFLTNDDDLPDEETFVSDENEYRQYLPEHVGSVICPYILKIDDKEYSELPLDIINRFAIEHNITLRYLNINTIFFYPESGFILHDEIIVNIHDFDVKKIYDFANDVMKEIEKYKG